MSGGEAEQVVRSAVPIPDLSIIDEGLRATVERLREAVRQVRPADLGRDLSRRTAEQGRRLVEASDDRRAAAILRAAHPAVAANVLAKCEPACGARLLDFMPTDHQVAILGTMRDEDRARIQSALDLDDKAKIERLLSYGDTAVARLMTPKVWRCPQSATVGDALAGLRAGQDSIEVAQNCYVVDDGGKVVGVVPLRLLAVTEPATPIESVMSRDPIAVSEETERAMPRRSSRRTTSSRSP
jgi:Mg/Co/Ni transporter MgtE